MRVVSVLLVGLLALAAGLTRAGAGASGHGEEPDTRTRAPLTAPAEARTYPGIRSLVDAVRYRGSWYLLDVTEASVHVLQDDERVGSFPVGGPGDTAGRLQVVLAHGDTIAVIERRGGLMHLHAPDGTLLDQRRLTVPGCPSPGIFDAVSRPEGLVTLAICPGRRLNTRAFAVLEAGENQPRVLASTAARPRPEADVDPYFTPVLVEHPRGIAFGNAREDCLVVAELTGATADSLCHRALERLPAPTSERAAVFRARVLARARGARLAPAETLPPFDRVYPADDGGYRYRVPVRGSTHARTLVSHEGRIVTGREVPPANRVFAAPGEALFGWLRDGSVRLARYRLPG